MFEHFGINAGFVEEQYLRFLENPQLVDKTWRSYFEAMGDGTSSAKAAVQTRGDERGSGPLGYEAYGAIRPATSNGNGNGNGNGDEEAGPAHVEHVPIKRKGSRKR